MITVILKKHSFVRFFFVKRDLIESKVKSRKILSLKFRKPEPHGSCIRLLLTIAHLKTALYPRENCTGRVPGPYGFGLPARVLIAHILPSRALHGHVDWMDTNKSKS